MIGASERCAACSSVAGFGARVCSPPDGGTVDVIRNLPSGECFTDAYCTQVLGRGGCCALPTRGHWRACARAGEIGQPPPTQLIPAGARLLTSFSERVPQGVYGGAGRKTLSRLTFLRRAEEERAAADNAADERAAQSHRSLAALRCQGQGQPGARAEGRR